MFDKNENASMFLIFGISSKASFYFCYSSDFLFSVTQFFYFQLPWEREVKFTSTLADLFFNETAALFSM